MLMPIAGKKLPRGEEAGAATAAAFDDAGRALFVVRGRLWRMADL
jgi:hypothetical protein